MLTFTFTFTDAYDSRYRGKAPAETMDEGDANAMAKITDAMPREAIEETFRHADTMISSLFVSILKAANAQKRQVRVLTDNVVGCPLLRLD